MCVIGGDTKLTGTVTFEQDSELSPTKISWNITGHVTFKVTLTSGVNAVISGLFFH